MKETPILKAPHIMLLNDGIIYYLDKKLIQFRKEKLFTASTPEIIVTLTGYETIRTEENCGGFADIWNKRIAIVDNTAGVILHEMSHAFQADMGIFDKSEDYNNLVISKFFKAEQQCETMARYMFKKLYGYNNTDYLPYFSQKSLDFLIDWYKGTSIQLDIKNI